MKTLSRFILNFVIALLFFEVSSFALPACGFSQKCPDGLACIGSTGTENNGICVLTGPSIAICKTTTFVKDFAKYFEIFSIVALGFAFFLGKISWGMIISVILGVAVIEGAVPITQKLAGDSATYCSSDIISYISAEGCRKPQWKINTSKSKMNVKEIYNTSPTDICPKPFSCTKRQCVVAPDNNTAKYFAMQAQDKINELSRILQANSLPKVDRQVTNRFKLRFQDKMISTGGTAQSYDTPAIITFLPKGDSNSNFTDLPNYKVDFVPEEFDQIPMSKLINSANGAFPALCTEVKNNYATYYLSCTHSCSGVTQTFQTTQATCPTQ